MRNIKKLIDIVEEDKSYPFVAFKARHLNEEIEGIELYEEIYGKDKVRTLHVVLVLCLNLAVDPPDTLVKVSPCSKMEAWFDPKEKNLNRALEMIGKNLQIQYERWQPKARYRQSLDPTIEEIHRLCQSLRRSAREDRVLFHYNGHGVPRPTENGEIWVFNKAYTKYIPLSLYDLHSWMGGPTVYVFDCNNAGRIIRMMEQFSMKRFENNGTANSSSMDNIIILASCQENEDIPQNPEVPADLFTSCLTTPIKIALHWYLLRNQEIFPNYLNETMLELIGGSPSNRVSMFGEINWVFTAVTDTIAWSCLPPPLFQKLFRQDLLVASLFRNFLLAERIMHYYGLRPVSYPPLPKTYEHPMWDAWDHALDCYTSQLPEIYHKKQSMNNSNNTENLLIIRHPSFDPLIVNNMSNNDSSEEDDDDIDEDEDMSTKDKIMQSTLDQQKLIPRNVLLTDDFQELLNIKNENTKGFNQTEKFQQERSQKQDLIQTAWNDALKQHNNTNVFNTRKPQILPNPRVLRQNSQSGKVFPISKTNNLNPLNGPICDLFPFKHTDFFNDHMTAFELWLKTADEKKPVPIQLPILLQVLLSQVHRYRALRLLSEYMDLGPWAVIQCLTVGIFPYVVRLLQSPVYDVKPYLVFIWGKIISSAQTDFAKNDVVKDAGYKYFVSCLTENEPYEIIIKTISAFALAKMLNNNPVGQKLYIKQNFMTVLIEELENNPSDLANDNYIRLRIWFILSFAKLWSDNDDAKWYGVRQQIHEKLLLYLKDISPEVRAATVYALGTFLNNKASDGIRSKHAVQVEQNICQHLLNHSVNDSSPLVRAELVVAMKYMVNLFSNQVMSMAIYYDVWLSQNNHGSINDVNNGKFMGPPSPLANRNVMPSRGSIEKISKRLFVHSPPALTDKISVRQKAVSSGDLTNFDENNNTFWLFKDSHIPFILPDMYLYGNINSTRGNLKNLGAELSFRPTFIKKVPAVSNFTTYNSGFPIINIYAQMWFSLILLSKDPYPKVSILASKIVEAINLYKKITQKSESNELNQQNTDFQISPKLNCSPAQFIQPIHSALFPSHNRKIDAISSFISTDTSSDKYLNSFEEGYQFDFKDVSTDFFNWSSKYFTLPLLPFHKLAHLSIPGTNFHNENIKSINSMQYLNQSKSFDKVSYKKLPNLIISESKSKSSARRLMHVIDSAKYEDRNERLKKQKNIKLEGAQNWKASLNSSGTQLSQIFLQKIDSKPELLKFHPYLNYLAVVDRSGVSLWNWESGQRAQYMLSQSVSCKEETEIDSSSSETSGYITSLEFINAEEDRGGLILVGTMDGRIKIWRNYLRDMGQDPDIVTAWIALPDQICSNRPSGLITHWSQSLGQLTISGDVKYIRLWDSLQECKISDMNTNSESCVSSIDRSQDGRLIVAGFGDGHIKMFDIRAPVNECVINAGVGDMGWIHKVAYSDSTNQVYSIGIYGELTTWCVRQRNLPKPYITPSRRPNPLRNTQNVDIDPKATSREGLLKDPFTSDSKLTLAKSINHSLKLQPVHCADLRVSSESDKEHLAVIGYGKESRGILTAIAPTGSINSNFKYFEGFSRANIEAPTSVCVHPYQTLVGAGLEDSSLLLLKLLPK